MNNSEGDYTALIRKRCCLWLLKENTCFKGFKVFAHPCFLYRKLWYKKFKLQRSGAMYYSVVFSGALKSSRRYISKKTTCLLERREIMGMHKLYRHVRNTRHVTFASLPLRYCLVSSCSPRPVLTWVLGGLGTDQSNWTSLSWVGLERSATHLKSKSNDVGQFSHLYLLATEGQMFCQWRKLERKSAWRFL